MNASRRSWPTDEGRSKRQQIDELADAIAVHAARIDAATQQLLTEIRRFDEMGGWAWQGAKSCAHWLCWRVGLGRAAAAEKVRVARALGGLPLIDAAFAAGQVSYSKVRAMTRVATEGTEERLLEMAQHATGAQLERICRGFRQVARVVARSDEERKGAAMSDRWLQRRTMPDGMVRIEAQLLADEAEVVWAALEQVRQGLRAEAGAREEARPAALETAESSAEDSRATAADHEGLSSAEDGGETRGAACHPSRVDALVALADRALDRSDAAGKAKRRARPLLLVHLSEERLAVRGAAVPATDPSTQPALECLASDQVQAGVTIDRRTSLPRWDGTPLDLGAAVAGLWRRHERSREAPSPAERPARQRKEPIGPQVR